MSCCARWRNTVTADRHESPRLRATIPRGTGTAAGAGDEAVGTNAGTARLKHSRLRKQQRPGCACLRARGAAELRQPALGGQPQFITVQNAPRVVIPPPSKTPPVSPCKPLCAILLAKVSVYPLSPVKTNVSRLCECDLKPLRRGLSHAVWDVTSADWAVSGGKQGSRRSPAKRVRWEEETQRNE